LTIAGDLRLLQEIKHPVKRAATSSQFQQYAGIPDHYSLELALDPNENHPRIAKLFMSIKVKI
jgi:hypothetical protein